MCASASTLACCAIAASLFILKRKRERESEVVRNDCKVLYLCNILFRLSPVLRPPFMRDSDVFGD